MMATPMMKEQTMNKPRTGVLCKILSRIIIIINTTRMDKTTGFFGLGRLAFNIKSTARTTNDALIKASTKASIKAGLKHHIILCSSASQFIYFFFGNRKESIE